MGGTGRGSTRMNADWVVGGGLTADFFSASIRGQLFGTNAMNACSLKHQDLTEKIIGVFFDAYNELGHGFLESVYEAAMLIALRDAGLQAEQQVPIPAWFRGQNVGDFRGDVIVEQAVMLELKAVRALEPVHEAQLINYLRATPIEVGLLLNFGPKPSFKRFAYDNDRKAIRG